MQLSEPIAIAGFMGAGKTSVGKALAELYQAAFRDLDDIIVDREGMSINQIFDQKGEDYFRSVEIQYLQDKLKTYSGILALGGGTLQDNTVVEQLKKYAVLIFLDTPFSVIFERLKRSKHRPLLLDESGNLKDENQLRTDLQTLYNRRLPRYQQADIIFKPDPSKQAGDQARLLKKRIDEYVENS